MTTFFKCIFRSHFWRENYVFFIGLLFLSYIFHFRLYTLETNQLIYLNLQLQYCMHIFFKFIYMKKYSIFHELWNYVKFQVLCEVKVNIWFSSSVIMLYINFFLVFLFNGIILKFRYTVYTVKINALLKLVSKNIKR